MRSRIIVVACASLAALPSAAGARGLPGLLTQVKPGFHVRPSVIVYTGDGSGLLGGPRRVHGRRFPASFGRLGWRTWNHRYALSYGTAWLDDCNPNCAQGSFHAHRARIVADHIRGNHFTHLTISYRYHGRRITDRRVLRRFNRVYVWG